MHVFKSQKGQENSHQKIGNITDGMKEWLEYVTGKKYCFGLAEVCHTLSFVSCVNLLRFL